MDKELYALRYVAELARVIDKKHESETLYWDYMWREMRRALRSAEHALSEKSYSGDNGPLPREE